MKILIALIFLLAAAPPPALAGESFKRSYRVLNNGGVGVGVVEVVELRRGVLLRVKVRGLRAGAHGLHLHKVGDCSDHGGFKKSGGHISLGGEQHGFANGEGHHIGDLPNLLVGRDGRAQVELYVDALTLEVLRDQDGSALVIHAKLDDHKSQPIGGSGARIACAEIK